MKYENPDIDIDTKDRDEALTLLTHTPAAIIKDGKLRKHNTGVYVTDIPIDPLTGNASIDHKDAETRGYFKLDFLNMGVYTDVKDENHLNTLIEKEPNWQRLWTDKKFLQQIVHIGTYSKLINKLRPQSLLEMAMFLSIIRPGKKHLQQASWDEISKSVWDRTDADGYTFRKAHALSYAMLVQVHMNLIEEKENE